MGTGGFGFEFINILLIHESIILSETLIIFLISCWNLKVRSEFNNWKLGSDKKIVRFGNYSISRFDN